MSKFSSGANCTKIIVLYMCKLQLLIYLTFAVFVFSLVLYRLQYTKFVTVIV